MKPGQFVFYIVYDLWVVPNLDDVCNLPGVGYMIIKKSPYRLMLGRKYA